jgi:alpha-glucosidase
MIPDWLLGVHHDGSTKYVSHLHPRIGDAVRIRLRVGANAPVRRVFLRTYPEGEWAFTLMTRGPAQPPVRWFEIDLRITDPITHYRFVIEADDGVWWYAATGPAEFEPLDAADFRMLADVQPLPWIGSTVFYQIFPDRFANGDPANDPQPAEYDDSSYPYRKYEYEGQRPRTFPWGSPPPEDQAASLVFYGGDLAGIAQRLGYLEKLGVGALLLTPVFPSPSNHRYDATDFEHVDPRLGGDAALAQLREALTQRGMRYVLGLELRHVSYWHPWFQAARKSPAAPEAEFFTFSRHPEGYSTWLGVWSLPKLNYRSEELRRRLFTGPEAALRRWLLPPYAADGWRTSFANALVRGDEGHLATELARTVHHVVKETQPGACVVTEDLVDTAAQLRSGQLDGATGFRLFTIPIRNWLHGFRKELRGLETITGPPWSTSALDASWRQGRTSVPWSVTLHRHVQLGSHDLPRIRTVVHGNDALHRLAAIVQFTYPGVPVVYYGDEIGLEDQPYLAQRGCMEWDERRWNAGLLALYRDLIALRRSSPVLQEGGFQMLLIEPDTFAFQREGTTGRVLVIAHRGERSRLAGPMAVAHGGIADGTRFVERFSGQVAVVKGGELPLPELPQGATLWIAEEPAVPERRRGRPRVAVSEGPPERSHRARCPICGRQDGARLERRLTHVEAQREERWVCLWCGATWSPGR